VFGLSLRAASADYGTGRLRCYPAYGPLGRRARGACHSFHIAQQPIILRNYYADLA